MSFFFVHLFFQNILLYRYRIIIWIPLGSSSAVGPLTAAAGRLFSLRFLLRYGLTPSSLKEPATVGGGTNQGPNGIATRASQSSQVKSSIVVGLRDRVAIIRTLLFSSPQPYTGSGDLIEVGR